MRRMVSSQEFRCAAALAVAGLLWSVGCSRTPVPPVERAAALISADRIERNGRALSDDDMGGRYYASPEADSAAALVLGQLRALHIPLVQRSENVLGRHPACFTHHFSVTLYRLGSRNQLVGRHGGAERPAELGHDYVPLVFSRRAAVTGRVVRIEDDTPTPRFPPDAVALVTLPGPRPANADLYARVRSLENRGAAAVLFEGDGRLLSLVSAVYPSHLAAEQHAVSDSPRGAAANLTADRMSLASQSRAWQDAESPTIPALVVRSSWADRLQTGDLVQLRADIEPEVSLGQNVLVGFRGKDRPDEVVVLAANYDHAGINAAGDVLNGANDNASGVAALLEIAAALAAAQDELQRSVVVAFFSGSRAGLQGSEALLRDWSLLFSTASHPVRMIGLRAIGRDDGNPLLAVGGTPQDDLFARFEPHDRREELLGPVLAVQRAGDEANDVSRIEIVPGRGSDHLSFVRAGIPALLLTDGMDPGALPNPADDWRTVNAAKIARVARLVFRTTLDLAGAPAPAVLPAAAPKR